MHTTMPTQVKCIFPDGSWSILPVGPTPTPQTFRLIAHNHIGANCTNLQLRYIHTCTEVELNTLLTLLCTVLVLPGYFILHVLRVAVFLVQVWYPSCLHSDGPEWWVGWLSNDIGHQEPGYCVDRGLPKLQRWGMHTYLWKDKHRKGWNSNSRTVSTWIQKILSLSTIWFACSVYVSFQYAVVMQHERAA